MTQKILITEVGGRKCPQRIEQDYEGDIASFCKINALNPCLEENCPHGITISEAADIMLRFGLLGKSFDYSDLPAQRRQREEELEHLLEVKDIL